MAKNTAKANAAKAAKEAKANAVKKPVKEQVEETTEQLPPVSDEAIEGEEDKVNTVEQGAAKKKKRHPGPWVKMSLKEVEAHSKAGTLFGYDPKTGEGIIKE